MILSSSLLAVMLAASTPSADMPARPVQLAQMTLRQQIIIRVPARPRSPRTPGALIEWKEKKGPKCVPVGAIAGATLLNRDSVDLVMRDNSRIRAKLDRSCPALDYYNGFYIAPQDDGMICADRDVIRSRTGGKCQIGRFRRLVPERRD